MTFKQQVQAEFLKVLNAQIDAFQFALDQLSESVSNETKSTAGDKHETALSMLQLEQSRVAKHLYEAVDNKTTFSQIDFTVQTSKVASGSLVTTCKGMFLLCIALSKINLDDKTIIAISPKSPLGEALFGKMVDEKVNVLGIEHLIVEIQ